MIMECARCKTQLTASDPHEYHEVGLGSFYYCEPCGEVRRLEGQLGKTGNLYIEMREKVIALNERINEMESDAIEKHEMEWQ